jgi:hypothetical protein
VEESGTMKEKLKRALLWLAGKFQEPSSWKGIIMVISAGSWNRLDSSSKGEVIMQFGLIAFGLILFFLSQEQQYGEKK